MQFTRTLFDPHHAFKRTCKRNKELLVDVAQHQALVQMVVDVVKVGGIICALSFS